MAEPLTLFGYGPSVYTRIVRMALAEMGLVARYVEVDPFADPVPDALLRVNPVGRVPVLRDGEFVLTETAAILRYLDGLCPDPSRIPQDPRASARMAQVMGVVDAYLYVPLVRRVFAHGFFAPREGAPHDPDQIAHGLAEAAPALALLERIAAEGLVLSGEPFTLADLHVAPMIDYAMRVPQARDALDGLPALAAWWQGVRDRPSLVVTDPFKLQ